MKLNLVISSNSSWNIYNFRMDLLNKLSKKYNIIIAAPYDKYTEFILKDGYKYIDIKLSRHSKNIFNNLSLFFKYFYIFYKYKPVIFLGFTIKPNLIGTFASIFFKNIKVFNFITGLGLFFFENNFFHNVILFFYKIIFFKSKGVFFQNDQDKNYFIEKKLISLNKCYLTNGSGIDLKFYNNKEGFINSEFFIFLCICRIIKDKGIIEYIKAAELIKNEYPNVIFQLLGSIDKKYTNSINLDFFKKSLNKNVIKHFEFSNDVRPFITKADCIVLASYREGTSRSLLEGAALNKPLIASNVPGCNNIVKDNFNGYLFEPKNVHNTYQAMKKMLNLTPEKRKLMGERSREYINNRFEINLVNSNILKIIYENV